MSQIDCLLSLEHAFSLLAVEIECVHSLQVWGADVFARLVVSVGRVLDEDSSMLVSVDDGTVFEKVSRLFEQFLQTVSVNVLTSCEVPVSMSDEVVEYSQSLQCDVELSIKELVS